LMYCTWRCPSPFIISPVLSGLSGVTQQMNMIGHQAPSMDSPPMLFCLLSQYIQIEKIILSA